MTGNPQLAPILASTLKVLEAAEANLAKAERLWERIDQYIPEGIAFGEDPEYDRLRRSFAEVVAHIPAIGGWKPAGEVLSLNDIAQYRFDVREADEIHLIAGAEEEIVRPGRELAEYRFRFDRHRRALIRTAAMDLLAGVDRALAGYGPGVAEELNEELAAPPELLKHIEHQLEQVDTLLGSSVPRPPRWPEMRRHLQVGRVKDLRDFVSLDWPVIRPALESSLYGEDEPLPVPVTDLDQLGAIRPKETIPTALVWERLGAEDFERLVFCLLRSAAGYENPEWLMATAATDRGRDLSVTRVRQDALSGTKRERVIVQCKHWRARSVGVADVAAVKEQMRLWEPPRVDSLIIVTSGRFSSDAVRWIETHNASDAALHIEMWPESHLEALLAGHPALIAEFGLR